MSDILDYIRSKLSAQPLTPETVEAAILDARLEYGGDAAYVRRPRVRDFLSGRRAAPSRSAESRVRPL
ncbi:MAG: hypothetical protein ABTS22_13115 [Accumulibacter sp.]|uniref:hypothetical protein n=1 Tax=Accumulibacter sp. TaxID=2053492 RepID=UPI00331590BD